MSFRRPMDCVLTQPGLFIVIFRHNHQWSQPATLQRPVCSRHCRHPVALGPRAMIRTRHSHESNRIRRPTDDFANSTDFSAFPHRHVSGRVSARVDRAKRNRGPRSRQVSVDDARHNQRKRCVRKQWLGDQREHGERVLDAQRFGTFGEPVLDRNKRKTVGSLRIEEGSQHRLGSHELVPARKNELADGSRRWRQQP